MPVAADLSGNWTWNHRTDVSRWLDQPVTNATHYALMGADVAARYVRFVFSAEPVSRLQSLGERLARTPLG